MSEEDKVCVKCGRRIPGDSRFCPYCGAVQPVLSTTQTSNDSKSRTAQRTNPGMSPLSKLLAIILVLGAILVFAKFTTFKDGPSHHKIEEEIQLNMFEGQTAYGKHPKVTVDKHKGTIIKISYKSTALKNIKSNPEWQTLVNKTVKKSKEFNGIYGNKKYSDIRVRNDKSKKSLLKVDRGKILYNQADK